VANEIKYYQMWNEWNLTFHWVGTMQQLYQMIAPAVAIIRANVPGAIVLMPSVTPTGAQGSASYCDLLNWMNYETANGVISDWVDWHTYLTTSNTTIATPEVQWANVSQQFFNIKEGQPYSGCSSGSSAPGWAGAPWVNSETNFDGAPQPGLFYSCPSATPSNPPTTYSPADCEAMSARWQIIHDSYGAAGVWWYYWWNTIGQYSTYETPYYYMMQYLTGGYFVAPASYTTVGGNQIWVAPFVETNNTLAWWVWTPSEAGTTWTAPAGYVDYRDLSGNVTAVTAGQTITIGVSPVLVEQ
jgi:hypothetical protein